VTAWRIRPAEAADRAAIVAVEAEAFASASWGAKAVADGFSERNVKVIVAAREEEKALCGFAFWRRIGDEAEILSIGVARRVRRQGCARAMLEEIVETALGEGVRSLFLEVDVANAAAAILYQSMHFEKVGRRKRYYKNGGDALVMRLIL
jgi:ribosomal-protein-alanine N-acetyltransferase